MSEFLFQAHRGDSVSYPENTLCAYKAAVEQGYGIVEMDCKFTKDNVCIMLHDSIVNRTCRYDNGDIIEGKISSTSLTLAEIQSFDAGIFKGEQFRGVRVPTLAQTLSVMKGSGSSVKLDNVFQSFNEEQFEIFCRTVEEADMGREVGFTTKTIPYFAYLAKRFPEAQMHYDGLMTREALEFTSALAGERTTYWIPYKNQSTSWFNGRFADEEFAAEVRKYGRLAIWTIGTLDELRDTVKLFGASAAETNGQLKPYMLAEI